MKILSIDTACSTCSVALSNNAKIISSFFEMRKSKQAEQLLPMVFELLIEANLDYSDIDVYAVNIGPGSFTGIRIGVSAAHGFNIASSKPVIGVTSLESLALKAKIENLFKSKDDILTVLDAGREQAYIQVFANDLEALSDPELINISDAKDIYDIDKYIICGNAQEILDLQENQAKKICATTSAEEIAQIAYQKIKNNKNIEDINLPYPFYIRQPDAIISKND